MSARSFGHFNAKAFRREHPGCLFSCCFRTFSISLERFPALLATVSSPPFFSQQITVEPYRRRRKARKPYVLSMFLNGSSGNFRFDVFVCLLRTINELRQRPTLRYELEYLYYNALPFPYRYHLLISSSCAPLKFILRLSCIYKNTCEILATKSMHLWNRKSHSGFISGAIRFLYSGEPISYILISTVVFTSMPFRQHLEQHSEKLLTENKLRDAHTSTFRFSVRNARERHRGCTYFTIKKKSVKSFSDSSC